MRIAMFSDCYFPTINGVSTAIRTLSQKLLDNGHQVLIVIPQHPDAHPENEGLFGHNLRFLRLRSKPCRWDADNREACPGVFAKWDSLRDFSPDIIHIHTPFVVGRLGISWARKLKVPCVFTYHTMWESYTHYLPVMPHFLAVFMARRMSKKFCNNCNAVIAPSNYVTNYLQKKLRIKRPIKTIPSGIDISLFNGGDMCEAAKYIPKVGATHLLYVGRLAQEKSLDFVWKVFARLRPRYPALRLVVVGDGPYRSHLEGLTKIYRLDDSIIFVGWKPRERLKHFYALARCMVFASQTETQGMVLGEAQAAGVPVVAVRCAGAEESIRDGVSGFLVDADDVDGFAECITRIIENGDVFNSMSRAARAWANMFNSDDMTEKVCSCYKELIDKNK